MPNELSLIVPDMLPDTLTLTDEEIERTRGYAENALAASSRAAYAADMGAWSNWALARGACPLPASPAVLAVYLTHLADSGRAAAGIGRAAAGIAYFHRQAGIDPLPTSHEVVRQTMRGVRRTIGTKANAKTPIVADLLMQMLKHCPGDSLQAKRNRALLAVGFATAMRRSELCALTMDCIQFVDDGMRVIIKRSKTDQSGETATIAVIRGVKIKPVALLQEWLAASGITEGPIFRPVKLGGVIGDEALRPNGVARIVKRVLAKVEGIDDVSTYSGHSLRSGFLTSAAEAKSSIFKMLEVSRHRNMTTLQGYVRSAALFDDHCSANFM